MRVLFVLGLAFTMSSCAITRQNAAVSDCGREYSYEKGLRDAQAGRSADRSFLSKCKPEVRPGLHAAYREGFESAKDKKRPTALKAEPALDSDSFKIRKAAPTSTWICEVEGNSRIFRGVGPNRELASQDALKSCSTHVQSAHCTESECNQSY